MKKQYRYFVGIDVSKGKLDVCLSSLEKEGIYTAVVDNSRSGVRQLVRAVRSHVPKEDWGLILFCMEHTGVYINRLLRGLWADHCVIWVESPLRIKQAIGHLSRGKDDQIDAKRIADFAKRHADRALLYHPRREPIQKLAHLMAIRNKLKQYKTGLATSLREKKAFDDGELKQELNFGKQSIKAMEVEIKAIEERMREVIREDNRLTEIYRYVTSVPGIGFVNGVYFIVVTNEFKSFNNPKAYATHAGVAPFPNRSGKVIKPDRVSQKAHKELKKNLQMAVTSLIGRNNELNEYYERKTAEGKHTMSVMNAMRNKLIHRVFACVLEERKYQHSKP